MRDKLADLIAQLNDLLKDVGPDATYGWADDFTIQVFDGDEVACEFLAGFAPDWMPGFPKGTTLGEWRDHDGDADNYYKPESLADEFPRMGVVRLRDGRVLTDAEDRRTLTRKRYPHGSNGPEDVVAYRPVIWRGKEMKR